MPAPPNSAGLYAISPTSSIVDKAGSACPFRHLPSASKLAFGKLAQRSREHLLVFGKGG